MSAESESLREYFESQLKVLREQVQVRQSEDFAISLASLQLTIRTSMIAADEIFESSMSVVRKMRAECKDEGVASRMESMARKMRNRSMETAQSSLDRFVLDCSPSRFQVLKK